MSIEKIKNPIQKISERLDSFSEEEAISQLDREYLADLLKVAYDELLSQPVQAAKPPQHPGQNERFQFESDPPPPPKSSAPTPPPQPEPAPEQPSPAPAKEEQKDPAPAQSENGTVTKENAPAAEIFDIKESTELSERLSQMPISDIWRAMGLNERIFTQNELFGGDHEVFQSTVQRLNECSTFEEAKSFLMEEIVDKYDWADEGRKNIAKNFIRLIRRKYKE